MSDSTQGPGWWQASDGKWYPPESHPDYQPSASMPPPPSGPTLPPQPTLSPVQPFTQQVSPGPLIPADGKKPWWRRWWAIALGVLVVIVGLGALTASNEPEDETPAAGLSDGGSAPDGGSTEADSGDAPSEEEQQDEGETTVPPTTEATPEEPETPMIGSREQPFAVGSPAVVTLDTFGDADGSVWAISVDGPGADITAAVLEENMFNEPPEEGRVFYGAPVTLTLQSAGKEPLSPLFNISLEFFGPSTLEIFSGGLTEGCGVTPNDFDSLKEVFVGGSISGMVCYSVTAADVEAGIMLTLDGIEGDRIFLATR